MASVCPKRTRPGVRRDTFETLSPQAAGVAETTICRFTRLPGPGHSQMPGMNVDLVALAASPDFDRAFIQAMIPHHQSAIDMSRAAMPNLNLGQRKSDQKCESGEKR